MTQRRRAGAPTNGAPGSSTLHAVIVASTFTAVAIAAVAAWQHWDTGSDGLHTRMNGWLLAAMFAVTQAAPLHVQRAREARAVTLSEIPFVLGLLFVSPLAFVLARTAGGAATVIFRQRQYRSPVKLAFNVVLF